MYTNSRNFKTYIWICNIVQCNMRTLYLINECFTSFEFLGFVMLHKWSKDRTSLAYWTQNVRQCPIRKPIWPLSLKAKRAKIKRVQNNQCVFPSFTGNVREDAIAKLVWTKIGFSLTSVRAKYCCEIEINKSFSDPLLN